MRYLLLFILFITIPTLTHARFGAYYPNGKRVTIQFENIKGLLDSLGISEYESHSHKHGIAYFKRLTNQPLFVFFFDKEFPLEVKEIISSYNYPQYLNSYSYYWDLKDMIKTGSLTKTYLREVFKAPENIEQNEDGSELWIYKKHNCKVSFNGENAAFADVINFKAIERNALAIASFDVTGTDYTIGCEISLTNYSPKTIKYAFITVTATNPVDDKVGTKTIRAIGPVRSSETASYEFHNIIYSRTAKYLSVDNIRLQYMDGSTRTISKSEVQNIRIKDWEEIGQRTANY